MTTIIAGGVFLIAVIGFAIMIKNAKAKKTAPEESTSPPPGSTPDQEYKVILDSLLNLNIKRNLNLLFLCYKYTPLDFLNFKIKASISSMLSYSLFASSIHQIQNCLLLSVFFY